MTDDAPSNNEHQPDTDPRPAAVTFVTTEHFTLQGARSSTIAEATGRATMFLGTVSGGLIALGLIATAAGVGAAFYAFGLVLLPTLAFLGVSYVITGNALEPVERRVTGPLEWVARHGAAHANPNHVEMSLDQLLSFRPSPSLSGYRTPIGRLFLTDHLLAFEITSIVLLVAAVGGVILGILSLRTLRGH